MKAYLMIRHVPPMILAGWIGCLAPASAELTVIYDSGDTRPIAPYLKVFGNGDSPPSSIEAPPIPHLGAADPENLLPIRSEGLSPGPVAAQAHERPFSRPFFLVGSDGQSRRWLEQYRDRLKEIGAVGMLVQADTLNDLRSIARLADGLSILPGSATDIAQALGVTHYPVLITPRGIEQ